MPNDSRAVAAVNNRDLATMPLEQALDAYSPNFAAALPSHIPLERFKRTVITALNQNPDLRDADRRFFFNAAVKCAHDGLYPDGREAALVVFKTKIKDAQGEYHWIKATQYMPMIAGIRKRMRNTGEVLSATAEVVYQKDRFAYVKGENPHIEHEPPPLGEDRGQPIGAYAIIKLANGEVLREVMDKREIERARAVSRSGQDENSPWSKWWDEMARKTVLRRCAKGAPTGSELDRLLARDDEAPEMALPSEATLIPPRPRIEDYTDALPNQPPTVAIVDADGEEREVPVDRAEAELPAILAEMERRSGKDGVVAFGENNAAALTVLREAGIAGPALAHAERLAGYTDKGWREPPSVPPREPRGEAADG